MVVTAWLERFFNLLLVPTFQVSDPSTKSLMQCWYCIAHWTLNDSQCFQFWYSHSGIVALARSGSFDSHLHQWRTWSRHLIQVTFSRSTNLQIMDTKLYSTVVVPSGLQEHHSSSFKWSYIYKTPIQQWNWVGIVCDYTFDILLYQLLHFIAFTVRS